MTEEGGVFTAFLAVQKAVEAIGKNKRVTEGPARFSFRGVDDVMDALHGPMSEHGLICVPQVQERIPETRATSRGGTMNVVHLRVRFMFSAADGSSFFAEVWGEGQDSGDKATGKAHSMAYKSALLEAFHIPVESTPDADFDSTPAAPVQRVTDQRWLADIDSRLVLATSPSQVRGLWGEAVQVFGEFRLSEDDRAALEKRMTHRASELTPEEATA